MGVDEVNLSTSVKKSTASSAELAQMAAQIDENDNSEEMLQKKIEDLCNRGGDGIHGTAVRMEMFELKGIYSLFIFYILFYLRSSIFRWRSISSRIFVASI